MLTFIVVALSLLQKANFASIDVTMSAFPTITSGSYDVITSFGTPNTTKSNPYKSSIPDFPPLMCQSTITSSTSFNNTPKLVLGIISTTFDAREQTDYRQLAFLALTTTKTDFTLGIFVSVTNIIQAAKINYILFDSVVHAELNSNFGYKSMADDESTGDRETVSLMTLNGDPLTAGHEYGLLCWLAGYRAMAGNTLNLGIEISYYSTTQYIVKTFVGNDTSLVFIEWCRLFFDKTLIQKSQINFIDFGWIDGQIGKQNSKSDLPNYMESSYLVGVTKFQMSLIEGSDFTITRTNTSSFSAVSNFVYLNFTYFNYRFRSCPKGYPKYSDSMKLCFDSCPVSGTYLDTNSNENGLCLDCNPLCLTCQNSDSCTSCNGESGLVMNKQNLCECDSTNGFINETSIGECKLCSEMMLGCTQCTYNQKIICSSCSTPNYTHIRASNSCECQSPYLVVNKSSCLHCLDTLPGCISCTTNICDQCNSSLFLTSVEGSCQCVQGYFCVSEGQSFCSDCKQCSSEYYRQFVDGICQCIEGYSQCTSNGCDKLYCYSTTLDLNYSIVLTKDPNSNSLQYQITFNNPQAKFENIDWLNAINLGLPSSTIQSYSYKDGKVTITVNYNQNLQGVTTNITLDLSKSGVSTFSQVQPYTQEFAVQPSNNLAANVYDESTYNGNKILNYLTYVLVGLGGFTFLLGIYNSKVVVTQMIGVLQLSYVSLLLLDYGDPLIGSLVNLRFFYGADALIFGRPTGSSTKFNSLYYNSFFVYNMNIVFVVLSLPVVLGFVFFLISIPKTKFQKKFQWVYRLMIGEYLLLTLEFMLYDFVVSTVLFFKLNGQLAKKSLWFYISACQIAIFISIFTWNLVIFFFKNFEYFGQFKYLFRLRQQNYYYIPTLQRIMLGVVFVIGNSTFISAAVALGIILLGGIFVAALRPFTDIKHNYRSIFNSLCCFLVVGTIMMIKINESNKGENIYTKLPYGIVGILISVVIVSLSFVIKKFVQGFLKKKEQLKYQQLSKTAGVDDKVNEDYKKRVQDIINNPKSSQITRKLLANKMRKNTKPKFRPKVEPINGPESPSNLVQPAEQLSPDKFQRVNEMLREGLI